MQGQDNRAKQLEREARTMVRDIPRDRTSTALLPKIGFCASLLYLVFIAAMAIAAWDQLWDMGPNEFGDMLAGVFAPLAFFWLVLGFFQQGKELQASVAALRLQSEELRNSVEQQRDLVEVSREGLTREIEAYREARQNEEFAAQPAFNVKIQPRLYSEATYDAVFENAGKDITDVVILWRDKEVKSLGVMPTGQKISFRVKFDSASQLEDVSGYIVYTDGLGSRRARSFTFPVRDAPDRKRFGVGRIHPTIYKPPFPWASD